MHSFRSAFTLIELLVVIAILAVVVVLTLNPAEMLRQARDANRVSDMATINSALNLYTTDQSGISTFSLGNASSVYLSLPDTATTCANLNLPTTTPSGYAYTCASSTSSRNINSSGWIPVNFSLISSGSPLGSLPIDPTNQSSSNLYYTYYGNGAQYEATSILESQKYRTQYGQQPILPGYPEVNAVGNSLAISPLFSPSGLMGYWPMDEGSGSTTQDMSGYGNAGTWVGVATGTSGHYSPGKVGLWAGAFDGSTSYVVSTSPVPGLTGANGPITISCWIEPTVITGADTNIIGINSNNFKLFYSPGRGYGLSMDNAAAQTTGYYPPVGAWTFVTLTYNGTAANLYVNAVLKGNSNSYPGNGPSSAVAYIGSYGAGQYFPGLIDDVRVYNRVLSVAEIQALYNAQK